VTGNAPIGVFDSGVGGLSVARQFLRILPNEELLYFADTAHVPYGGRPLDEVRGFALPICDFLVANGAKMVVMACNISSAVALDAARLQHPDIPIIGVIAPGVQAALRQGARRIGVLATQGTVSSGAYTATAHRLDPTVNVVENACPRFVPLVEDGLSESADAIDAARTYLEPLSRASCDTIILGCTHYPFLINALTREAGDLFPADHQPRFVDPAGETVREAGVILADRAIAAPPSATPHHRYCTSGERAKFARQGPIFLGGPADDVIHVDLDSQERSYSLARLGRGVG
jgi:glutamate racemase